MTLVARNADTHFALASKPKQLLALALRLN